MQALQGVAALATTASGLKTVKSVLPRTPQHWVGNGFHVHPVFGSHAFTSDISPFLMLDYAVPKHFAPSGGRRGVGQHPHRGFETVTIAFQGEVEHADSMGNRGVIGPGDVQWMTAARGIVHEEFHSTSFTKQGGTFEMVQLWVNLPAEHKMSPPSYQPILRDQVPTVRVSETAAGDPSCNAEEADASEGEAAVDVRIIAGSFRGTRGPAKTFTPIDLWDVKFRHADTPVSLELPPDHNVMVLVRNGAGVSIGGKGHERHVGPQALAMMNQGGTLLRLSAKEAGTEVLVLAGAPIDEPIAARGPFVMNTAQEIREANSDYQSGRF